MCKKLLTVILILLLAISCSTTQYIEKEIPVETVKVEYKNQIQHDSVYVQDSVYIYLKGDTLYKYKYRTLYREKLIRDTLIVTDTIPKIITVNKVTEKEVYKQRTHQKILSYIGAFCLIGFVFYFYGHLKK